MRIEHRNYWLKLYRLERIALTLEEWEFGIRFVDDSCYCVLIPGEETLRHAENLDEDLWYVDTRTVLAHGAVYEDGGKLHLKYNTNKYKLTEVK